MVKKEGIVERSPKKANSITSQDFNSSEASIPHSLGSKSGEVFIEHTKGYTNYSDWKSKEIHKESLNSKFAELFPTRALFLLLFVAVLDLISTSWLFHAGLISERNPFMSFFIEKSNLLFILVKGSTIIGGWYFLSRYAKTHREFVRTACLVATTLYIGIWIIGVVL